MNSTSRLSYACRYRIEARGLGRVVRVRVLELTLLLRFLAPLVSEWKQSMVARLPKQG